MQLNNVHLKSNAFYPVGLFFTGYIIMPYELFKHPDTVDRGDLQMGGFAQVKQALVKNLEDLSAYYSNHNYNVPNEHLIVKMLLSLSSSMDKSNVDYVNSVYDLLARICPHFKITSPTSYGVIHDKGQFYNLETSEIYISDERIFDISSAAANWTKLRPIRILYHPFTDTGIGRLNGKYETQETGYVVISINIPMLALQYKMWVENERDFNGSVAGRTHQFVSKYPITNMMYSHLDWVLFNRMNAIYFGDELAPYTHEHPIKLLDVTDKLDDVLSKELAVLLRKPMSFDEMANGIPMITSKNLRSLARPPHGAVTRQYKWAVAMARLPLLRFMVNVAKESNATQNRSYTNRLRTQLNVLKQDKGLENILPSDFYTELWFYVQSEILDKMY